VSRVGFEQASADHRAAVEAAARVIEAQAPASWTAARDGGKWSPAEIAEHLALSYEPLLDELSGKAGFQVRLPWWKRRLARFAYLPKIFAGKFPKGAPAPRESRPKTGSATPAEAARRLRENAARFETELTEAHRSRRVRLMHPYFGKLTAPETFKLLAVHATHHRAQFPAAR